VNMKSKRLNRSARAHMLETLELRRLLSATIIVNTNQDSVADDGLTSLREAIQIANPGDTIDIGNLGTTINLSSELTLTKNVTIQGHGGATQISGQGFTRVFTINSGVTATLSSFGINGGFAEQGGAILNNGTLEIDGVGISHSTAQGADGFREEQTNNLHGPTSGMGGGIYNTGKLTLKACNFDNDQAIGGNGIYNGLNDKIDGAAAFGGGLYNASGATATMDASFEQNTARGGIGAGIIGASNGGFAQGGAIYNGGTLSMTFDQMNDNAALGGLGGHGDEVPGNGGNGEGGAIFNALGTLTLNGVAIFRNKATGGGSGSSFYGGGAGGAGQGGAIYSAGTANITGCQFTSNVATGIDSQLANGGAIVSTKTLGIINCEFDSNKAIGGNSQTGRRDPTPDGGVGFGGAVAALSGSVSVNGSTFSGNSATGGSGGDATQVFESPLITAGNGGRAQGGGLLVWTGVSGTVLRSTFFGNSAKGGNGGKGADFGSAVDPQFLANGNGGNAYGGAIDADRANLSITHCTIAGNTATAGVKGTTAGAGGVNGIVAGGGVSVRGTTPQGPAALLTVANSVFATNNSSTGPDVAAIVVSSGYNFVSKSNGSSGWVASDRTGTTAAPLDAKLSPLVNNGGLTNTMIPATGSPLIDAGKAFGFTTDQRGLARKVDLPAIANAAGGDGTDIGAVELQSPPSTTQTPFKTITIGTSVATIQNEDFDDGGEGVAYHDTEPKNLGASSYRTDTGVDLSPVQNDTGSVYVGFTKAGEWLEYTVNVATAGTYNVDFRVASGGSGGKFHLEVDGINGTGALTVPNTGGWQTWKTLTKTGVNLSAGNHVLRFAMDSNGATGSVGNFNYFKFTKTGSTTTTTIKSTTAAYVRGGTFANQNFGSDSQLVVKKDLSPSFSRETYIKFDLSSVASIGSAKLRLFGNLGDTNSSSVKIDILSSTNTTWTESGLTWNNRPATETTVRGSFTVTGTAGKTYDIDLTSYLKAQNTAGHNTVTLVLRGNTTATTPVTFASDEADANGPQLVIT
jgi:Carbohydrate binding module (family 6)